MIVIELNNGRLWCTRHRFEYAAGLRCVHCELEHSQRELCHIRLELRRVTKGVSPGEVALLLERQA